MSTGAECEFLEVTKDNWYYILEDSSAPKDAWNWRDYATAYGPFSSEELAVEHLRDNHANPGGYSSHPLPEGKTTQIADTNETLKRLIDEATSPTARSSAFFRFR